MTPGKHIGVLVTGTVDEASSAGTAQGERDYAIQSEIAKEVLGSAVGAGVAKAVDRGLDAARGAARADAPPTPARVEVVASKDVDRLGDSFTDSGAPVFHRSNSTRIGDDEVSMRVQNNLEPGDGFHDVVVHGQRHDAAGSLGDPSAPPGCPASLTA